ncbi:MAG: hypothetical protein ABSF62_24040 [Bryobacteraceae bacterium]|jgi:uncharacterized membrane protein YagU involved in acid resistance
MSNTAPFRLAAILWAGLIAGALDITDALVFYGLRGVPPVRLLQNIAGGLLGRNAFQGGLGTAALGLLLHFVIAYMAATVYYLLSRSFGLLTRHFIVCGLLYGLGVYLLMNHVVLPLAFVNRSPLSGVALVNGVLAVMLLVGLTVSIVVARYSR